MKKIGSYITYLIFRLAVGLIALIPFALLYKLSDFLAFLFRNIIPYRKKVILDNLSQCFPHWSKEELKISYRAFTVHLADIFLEGVKGFSMSREELLSRYKVLNPQILQSSKSPEKGILLAGSHYNNWEWGVLIFNQALPIQVSGIYQLVSNPFIQSYLMQQRAAFGMNLISARNAIQQIIDYPDPHAVMILSDQSPSNRERAIWLPFLNRDTACLHGLGVMAIKTGFPVFYYDVQRISRGYYQIQIELLENESSKASVESITEAYTKRLEQTILRNPIPWLWSHRRWKHTRTS